MTDLRLPLIDREKCTICGMCVEVCPESVLSVESGNLTIVNPKRCTSCAQCEDVCPEGAVRVFYQISWADTKEPE